MPKEIIIGGAPKGYDNNYDHMSAEDKKRVDKLFEKYPLKTPSEIDISISQEEIAKSLTGEDSKRVLTTMIVAWPVLNVLAQDVINHFKKEIEMHLFKMGYEVDYEFPGCVRAYKSKKKAFTWQIFIVSKKNKYNHRDIYFGEKGMGIKEMGSAIRERQSIKKQDFTKIK